MEQAEDTKRHVWEIDKVTAWTMAITDRGRGWGVGGLEKKARDFNLFVR